MKTCTFLAVVLILFSAHGLAELSTDNVVVKNDGSAHIYAVAHFSEPIEGDLYIATKINGEYVFIANEGSGFSTEAVPFRANSQFSEDIVVLDQSAQGVTPGVYPLYKVITQPGTNPMDFRNWVDGSNGLSQLTFIVGLPGEVTLGSDNLDQDNSRNDGAILSTSSNQIPTCTPPQTLHSWGPHVFGGDVYPAVYWCQ